MNGPDKPGDCFAGDCPFEHGDDMKYRCTVGFGFAHKDYKEVQARCPF